MRQKLLGSLVLLLLGAEWASAQQAPPYDWNYQYAQAAAAMAPYYGYYPAQAPAYATYYAPAGNYYPANYAPYPANYSSYYDPYYAAYYAAAYGNGYGYDTGNPSCNTVSSGYPPNPYPPAEAPVALPPAPEGSVPQSCAQEPIVPGELLQFPEEPRPTCAKPAEPHSPDGTHWGWVSGGYMTSWIRPQHVAGPLVSTGPAAAAVPGMLGDNGTVVLFGQDNIDFGRFDGAKLDVGLWLDECHHLSVDLGGFVLFPHRQSFTAASDTTGNPPVSRPVFDVATAQEGVFFVALPGVLAGSTMIASDSQMFGVELNGRYRFECYPHLQAEGLLGFRFLNLNERLTITDRLTPLTGNALTFLGGPVDVAATVTDLDSFQAINRFFGFQVGTGAQWDWGRFTVGGFAKVGLGITDESVRINGESTLMSPVGVRTAPGGILALPTNIGNHNRIVFGVVPEVGLDLGVRLTNQISLKTGYSFLLWNGVARPGNQIDRGVNNALVPTSQFFAAANGTARPAFAFHDEMFWINSFTFGFDFHF